MAAVLSWIRRACPPEIGVEGVEHDSGVACYSVSVKFLGSGGDCATTEFDFAQLRRRTTSASGTAGFALPASLEVSTWCPTRRNSGTKKWLGERGEERGAGLAGHAGMRKLILCFRHFCQN